jgi:hypothetical protein
MPVRLVFLVIPLALLLASCGTSSPPEALRSATPQPQQAAPVATKPVLTGTCTAGILDPNTGFFYPVNYAVKGDNGPPGADADSLEAAYQVTAKDDGSATADVTGFAVVFYTYGNTETGSEQANVDNGGYITAGQSLTFTETPWPSIEQAPFAAGDVGAVDTTATCKVVQWFTGPGS